RAVVWRGLMREVGEVVREGRLRMGGGVEGVWELRGGEEEGWVMGGLMGEKMRGRGWEERVL
ncbi:hypothetical protein, partial [Micrococcus luteus]|uniref:hypothetical protein n=1 Tax=Micrococcus luteus TaxID=1270 RepID=UPI001C92EE58